MTVTDPVRDGSSIESSATLRSSAASGPMSSPGSTHRLLPCCTDGPPAGGRRHREVGLGLSCAPEDPRTTRNCPYRKRPNTVGTRWLAPYRSPLARRMSGVQFPEAAPACMNCPCPFAMADEHQPPPALHRCPPHPKPVASRGPMVAVFHQMSDDGAGMEECLGRAGGGEVASERAE